VKGVNSHDDASFGTSVLLACPTLCQRHNEWYIFWNENGNKTEHNIIQNKSRIRWHESV